MQEDTNPYNAFFQMLDKKYKNREKEIFWGIVISENPLKIKTEGIIIEQNFIRFSESYYMKIKKEYSITCSHGVISHNIYSSVNFGDEVIMLRNMDRFVIIDKVVK